MAKGIPDLQCLVVDYLGKMHDNSVRILLNGAAVPQVRQLGPLVVPASVLPVQLCQAQHWYPQLHRQRFEVPGNGGGGGICGAGAYHQEEQARAQFWCLFGGILPGYRENHPREMCSGRFFNSSAADRILR